MKIVELLPRLRGLDIRGDVQREVVRVSRDSRDVDAQTVFVAIRGASVDGHDKLAGIAPGLAIVEREVEVSAETTVVRVPNARAALAAVAAALHGDPARSMRVVGVTGTKGKTTTAALIDACWLYNGRASGRIGTTGSFLRGDALPSELTTPEAPELQALFARMKASGATDVVMEVSSIGLVQRRVDEIPFHFALFTNLGRDHLDFHGTMEAYTAAKAALFERCLRPEGGMPRAALWKGDPAWRAMGAPADRWLFGFEADCDVQVAGWKVDAGRMMVDLATPFGTTQVRTPLIGRFNALNVAAAACAGLSSGLTIDAVGAGLSALHGVPGRFELIDNSRELLVVVDYAHTEESLVEVLTALRECTRGKLWVVFGCGGDRDPGKRPRMGAAAARLADHVVVTTDNPRSEPPLQIIDAILSGVAGSVSLAEEDRERAIRWTLAQASPGDTVLIAGKGHETYQEIQGVKYPFDDRVVARAAMEER